MDSKFYFLATICLIGGLVGGYLIASTNLQNQTLTYELRLQSKDAELSSKDTQLQAKDTIIQTLTNMINSQNVLIQELKANVTILQERIESLESQSAQAQTQIRIDTVDWGATPHTTMTVNIRNTGSVAATIESVAMRENKAGASFVTLTPDVTNPQSLDRGAVLPFKFTLAAPSLSTSYVIRVTATTGFYYELVATTPSS
jgi:hypothetical protein